jgi:hypothetical protein
MVLRLTAHLLICSRLTALDHQLLYFTDSLSRVESFGTGIGAIHNGVTPVQTERIFQRI